MISFNLLGQHDQIKGYIKDDSTKQAVVFAEVSLKINDSIIKTVITDTDGKFLFTKIKKGNYTLKVCGVGYPCIDNYKVSLLKPQKEMELFLKDYRKPKNVFEKPKK